jgi:carbonic anhydrase
VVTDDVIRSLLISQRVHDTTKVMVMMHTDCGLEGLDEGAIAESVRSDLGTNLAFALGSFDDLTVELRRGVAMLRDHPLIAGTVTGAIYDVTSDAVHTVAI